MTTFNNKYRVESARLRGWDYAAAGWYFVTICTHDRACVFGVVIDGDVQLSPLGEIACQYWADIPIHSPGVGNDAFGIMPNHTHGIVILPHRTAVEMLPATSVETQHAASLL